MTDNAVRLTYPQYRAVRRLVHDCCNYDGRELPSAGRMGRNVSARRAFPFR